MTVLDRFNCLSKNASAKEIADNFIRYFIWMIMEDCRMENCLIERYPGAKYDLDVVYHDLGEKVKNHTDQDSKLKDFFGAFFHDVFIHRGLDLYANKTLDECIPLIADEVRNEINHLPDTKSSDDVYKHSERIYELVKEELEEAIQEKLNNQKQQNLSSGSEEKTDAEIMENVLNDLNKFLESLDKGSYLKNQVEDSVKKDREGATYVSSEKDGESTKGTKVRGKSATGNGWYPPSPYLQDKILYPYTKVSNTDLSTVPQVKQVLGMKLKSQVLESWHRGLDTGKLDKKRLPQVLVGNDNVFKQKRSITRTAMDIFLLVDLSGSMDMVLTSTVLCNLHEALLSFPKVRHAIAGFTSGELHDYNTNYGRICDLNMPLIKRMEINTSVSSVIASLVNFNCGATPLGDAYLESVISFVKIKSPYRKVLWILTDGVPEYYLGNPEHNDFITLARAHSMAKSLNIETYGLEIISDKLGYLKDYVDYAVHIPSTEGMVSAVSDLASYIFTKGLKSNGR